MNRYFGLHTLEGEWHTVLPRYLLLAERVDGKRILDIGCGSGIGSSLLKELGADVVDAIDHRPAVLELARMKHAKDGLEFHVMFWEELGFEDETFDLVLCLDPSSPVTDPSLLEEVQRVLKPSGEYVCAIARRPIDGVEVLLPRYGYADAAENIDLHGGNERPPQVGELQSAFPRVTSVLQRPALSFVFDAEGEEGGEAVVDDSLRHDEEDDASVAVWFCGTEDAPPPPRRTVRMPYYGLVNRLNQVMNELQMRQVRGTGDDALFDEIVDSAEDAEPRERETTNEYRVVDIDGPESRMRDDLAEDDVPTNVRIDAGDQLDTRDRLESQLQELSALYQQVRHEFQNVVSDAQNALEERDRYIAHLVGQVQGWQERYGPYGDMIETSRHDPVPTGLSEDEMTTVYDGSDLDDPPTGQVDKADDDAEADAQGAEESSEADEQSAPREPGEEAPAEEEDPGEESADDESAGEASADEAPADEDDGDGDDGPPEGAVDDSEEE